MPLAFALAIALLAGCGGLLVLLAGRARRGASLALRHGLANLSRRRSASLAQIVAFGLAVMLLLVLSTLRRDLLSDWRTRLPPDAPNYFFVNIPGEQRDEFHTALDAAGARIERCCRWCAGGCSTINGVSIGHGPKRGGMAEREQNLTWSATLGDDNRIIAGRWWRPEDAGKPLVSVASEFQESLDLKLGDRLAFDVAGERIAVTVASFRKVKWDSFRPNFFLMFPPGLLDGAAGSYLTSASVRAAQCALR